MASTKKELVAGGARGAEGREALAQQYLTFTLAEEQYGVDILRVQEIKGWSPVTRIPNSPRFLCGVLNLRGTIVPVIDLRLRFGLDHADYSPTTVVIVLSVRVGDAATMLGVVVDGVSDVLNVRREEIRSTPDFGTVVDTDFIHGLAETDEGMVMLLDIDRLLSLRELRSLDKLAREAG